MSCVKFLAKFQNLNFLQYFKICNFHFVFFWLGIWYESLAWTIMRPHQVSQNAGVLVVLVYLPLFLQVISGAVEILWMYGADHFIHSNPYIRCFLLLWVIIALYSFVNWVFLCYDIWLCASVHVKYFEYSKWTVGLIFFTLACCLTAPSHYLKQCWLIISEILWH